MLRVYIILTITSLITWLLTLKKYKRIHKELSEIFNFSSFTLVVLDGIVRSFIPLYHIYISYMNMIIFSFNDKELENFIEFCKEDTDEI